MARTKINLSNDNVFQNSGDTLNLSGNTTIKNLNISGLNGGGVLTVANDGGVGNTNLYSLLTTGATEISFDVPRQYSTYLEPITATTLTNTNTGANRVIRKIYHQAASLTLPASWVKLASSGDYTAGAVNIIFVEYESASRKIYSITQDA